MKSRLTLFTALMLLPLFSYSQGTRLLRQPAVSDRHIAFVYADDIWIAGRDGGAAIRLTSNEGSESFPHFSPDGSKIAFTGQYDGNTDVYVVNTDGGEPERLTWHPGNDIVQGWMPDGRSVIFQSSREGVPTKIVKFYTVPLTGGLPQPMVVPQAAFGDISDDGQYLAYTPITSWDPEWRNYRGGQAQPIWILNLKTYELKQTPQTDRERHQDPVWYKGSVYFLSERDYANNIWRYNPANKELKQITFHKDFDVKSLDAGNDRIVYEQGGYLHLLDPASGKAKQLEINVKGDFHWARPRWENVPAAQLQNAALSPTGKRALFEYRGDIFTTPKEDGDGRNLTQSPGAADRSPVWSPDGQQIAWFSDESGEYQLIIADQYGENKRSISIPNATFFFKPAWSPDGKYIAFTDTDYVLWMVTVQDGAIRKVDGDRFAHPNRSLNPVWSPDSKWIAYAKILDNQFKAIFAYEVDGGKIHQLTDGLADCISPDWDASGKYLYFLASTDFGLNTGWLDMSSYEHQTTRGLYCMVLSKETASPLQPKSDEEEPQKEKDEKADKSPKDSVNVVIDLDGLDRRILAMDIPLRNYTGLAAGPKDHIFYWENVPNEEGLTLHRYSLKERKAIEFLKPVQEVQISPDRRQLLYRSNGSWGIVKSDGAAPKPGDGKLKIDLKTRIDPSAEWHQIFREGWRYMRDFLYVNNVHGAPWQKVYDWYNPWIDHVRHRTDLNYVVDIMSGEVSIGHSYVSGGDFPDMDQVPVGLLGADLSVVNGYYRIEKIYNGESWNPDLKAPLSGPGIDVRVGDYLLEVNGRALRAPLNPYSLFEQTAGKQVRIKVNNTPQLEGARSLTVTPVANENGLRSRDWVESNRRLVSEMSNGRLAYVYVPNTGNPGYTYFNRYYFSQQDKKGAVIDERNNGGGSAADYMVDIMARKLRGYFNSNAADHRPFTTPISGIWGPKVMLMNERAGSGGDLLPYLFKDMQIGPLIGTRTWGGLVGTWDTPRFIDGGRMVAPRGGFYDVNGRWAVEGEGIEPDITVLQDPGQVIRGGDPQLERAVQEALKLLQTQAIELKPEPPAPVRWKRPGN